MEKNLAPMLIGAQKEAFDDEAYIFELKMDGIRTLAYIEEEQVDLRNKRNLKLIRKFPEMKDLFQFVRKDCILDGELYCFVDQKIDFTKIQKRSLLSDPFKIRLESQSAPAVFTAFDILYYDGECVMEKPLIERKKLLEACILHQNAHFSRSRYIFREGKAFYEKVKDLKLEGIVAKKINSLYKAGFRTKDWIKIKYLLDDDFAVVGYRIREAGISLILAQYDAPLFIYIGQVMTSLSRLPSVETDKKALFHIEDAFWFKNYLTARVRFMEKTAHGSLRQPVLVDFITDKTPEECVFKK